MSTITWKQKLKTFSAHHEIQFDIMVKPILRFRYRIIVLYAGEIYRGNSRSKRT